jgi:hypothetical protein
MIKNTTQLFLAQIEMPLSLKELDPDTANEITRQLLNRLENNSGKFPFLIRPKLTRTNSLLLGAYTVHEQNYVYEKDKSLKEKIELVINGKDEASFIFPINSQQKFYAFKCSEFSYDLLDYLHDKTLAQTFVIYIQEQDVMFVFEEDSAFCTASYPNIESFESDLGKLAEYRSIFSNNISDWKITTLREEVDFLNEVQSYFEP